MSTISDLAPIEVVNGLTDVRLSPLELAECMVRRVNARERLLDEGKSASMYPAFRWRVFSWP